TAERPLPEPADAPRPEPTRAALDPAEPAPTANSEAPSHQHRAQPAPAKPPGKPPTVAQLAALAHRLSNPSWENSAPSYNLEELALIWGWPDDLTRPKDRNKALRLLYSGEESVEQWRPLPKAMQFALLNYATQRARLLQEVHGPLSYREESVFRVLSA